MDPLVDGAVYDAFNRAYKWAFDWRRWGPVDRWRFVRTSYVWLFIVPLGARFLAPFAGEHDVTLPWFGSEKTFHINIDLPFSWWAFLAMALLFLVARIIYGWRCPKIVTSYEDFGDYRSKATTMAALAIHCEHTLNAVPRMVPFLDLARIILDFHSPNLNQLERGKFQECRHLSEADRATITKTCVQYVHEQNLDKHTAMCFKVFEAASVTAAVHARRRSLFVVVVCYSAGLAFLGVVVVQNLWAMWKFLWLS